MQEEKKVEKKTMAGIYILILLQIIAIVLFATCVDQELTKGLFKYTDEQKPEVATEAFRNILKYFSFQDVQMMVIVGFGLLMTFQIHYAFGSVAITLYLTCFVMQWYILIEHFWVCLMKDNWHNLHLTVEKLAFSEFAAATVLISFGAYIGKLTWMQLSVISFLEVIFLSLNEYLVLNEIKVFDIGGAMPIHMFGPFFGLAANFFLTNNETEDKSAKHCKSTKTSNQMSLFGTVLLWLFWPSFNSILGTSESERHRAICNTLLSLSSACIFGFLGTRAINKKFRFEDIQNTVLAGGVVIASSCNIIEKPFIALIVGAIGGSVSTIGYNFILPLFEKKAKDVCGVLNLHGIPAILSVIISAIIIEESDNEFFDPINKIDKERYEGQDQIYGLLVTLGISIVSGLLCGLFANFIFKIFKEDDFDAKFEYYHDKVDFIGVRESDTKMKIKGKQLPQATELQQYSPEYPTEQNQFKSQENYIKSSDLKGGNQINPDQIQQKPLEVEMVQTEQQQFNPPPQQSQQVQYNEEMSLE